MQYADTFFRWMHVVAGITWIGLLYFFNWINAQVVPSLDAESKKKVLPELLPRALYWFRWGAAYTWFTGVMLLGLVFYMGGALWVGDNQTWKPLQLAMVAVTFLGVFVYDMLYKSVLKSPSLGFWGGLILASAAAIFFGHAGNTSFRGAAIHVGAMFGTIMAFNVWFRIWPAQQKIIMAIKNGQAPDKELAALAGLRSKHNTYMSVPLVFMMINTHMSTWADGKGDWLLPGAIFFGWAVTWMLYKKSTKVKGF